MMRLINTLMLITVTALVLWPIGWMISALVNQEGFHWFWTTGWIVIISSAWLMLAYLGMRNVFLVLWRRSIMNYVVAFFGLIYMIVTSGNRKR